MTNRLVFTGLVVMEGTMGWTDGLQTGDLCIDSCHSTMFGCLDRMYEAAIVRDLEGVTKLLRSFRDICAIHRDVEHSLFGYDHSASHSLMDDIVDGLHPHEFAGRRPPALLDVIHTLQRTVLTDIFHDKTALRGLTHKGRLPVVASAWLGTASMRAMC